MLHVLPSEVVKHIDRVFPWIRGSDQPRIGANDAGEIAAIVALVEAISPHLLFARSARYGQLLSSLAHVRSWLPTWQARGESWAANGQPLRVLRNVLSECPDEFPAPTTHELPFITAAILREWLRLDIEHVGRALAYGEWKATTVLAGSVIEALLLWKLGTLPNADIDVAAVKVRATGKACGWKTVKPLSDWHLPDYIEVAATVPTTNPVIVADTADLLRVVKNFRNLIHPGRAERLAQTCDKRTAYAAVAGMEGVVIDLSR